MTGRGRSRYLRPHYYAHDPLVTIGISVSLAPPFLDPGASSPAIVIINARIITSCRPTTAVTFSTFQNPFGGLPDNRAWRDIICVFPEEGKGKKINLNPAGSPQTPQPFILDLRHRRDFITLHPGQNLEVGLELPLSAVADADPQPGERYRISVSDLGLGTDWWMFGTMDDIKGCELRYWRSETQLEEEREVIEFCRSNNPDYKEEDDEWGYGRYMVGNWTMGEDSSKLALVIEKGEVDFEVVDSVAAS